MTDYFAQLPLWKAVAWVIALASVAAVLVWHIGSGRKQKPRDPWDWK